MIANIPRLIYASRTLVSRRKLDFMRLMSMLRISLEEATLTLATLLLFPSAKKNKASEDPTCTSFLEEHHKYHHDKHDGLDHSHHDIKDPDKLKKRNNHPGGNYLNLEYLSQLVKTSTVRRDIGFVQSVWKFDVDPEPYVSEADMERASVEYFDKVSGEEVGEVDGV
mmetsp:Transcript_11216/g.12328  ORF Transcript_11216/g.12328 Transcript_11216/m.12328 type:complete len:167 (+) Transcript_11216:747-1247(+)